MARFWRDEKLESLTISEDTISRIHDIFEARRNSMPEGLDEQGQPANIIFLYYIIRFDGKGIRVHSLDEVLGYFRQAHYVERVIITIESETAFSRNRIAGSFMELRLDERDPINCNLVVSSDDGDWVDASFSAVKEVVVRCKTRNYLARSAWANLALQLAGIVIVFLLSLIAAARMAPLIEIENAFFIVFLFVLLVFSNLWSFINATLIQAVENTFPNIRFDRPRHNRWLWLKQGLVIGVVLLVGAIFFDQLITYVGNVLGGLFGSG